MQYGFIIVLSVYYLCEQFTICVNNNKVIFIILVYPCLPNFSDVCQCLGDFFLIAGFSRLRIGLFHLVIERKKSSYVSPLVLTSFFLGLILVRNLQYFIS